MEEEKPMTKEEWEEILDANLLYILFDEFECYLAKINEQCKGLTPDEHIDVLDRLLKALVMFHARAVATLDLTLSTFGATTPNTIALTTIMHFIHAYMHTRQTGKSDMDEDNG
jgi:hypothetical protein